MRVSAEVEVFPLARAFTISRGSRTEARVLTVTVEADGVRGRGEGVPYARYGETPESAAAQVAGLPRRFRPRGPAGAAAAGGGAQRGRLRALGSRRRSGRGGACGSSRACPRPAPCITAYTLSLDTPEAMRAQAAENAHRPLLKVKLGGAGDLGRLEAVRAGAPRARIIVDANEGWTAEGYAALAPALVRLGVAMVEQPLPAGADAALAGMARPLPVCADESCHDRASLPGLAGRYDMVNIKLDKSGGLTEALALAEAARAAGFGIMVGCMVGTSLAMAPAVLVAQGAAITDLDGPLLLARDRAHGLRYDDEGVHPATPELWG